MVALVWASEQWGWVEMDEYSISFILSQGSALVKKYRHKYKYVVPR